MKYYSEFLPYTFIAVALVGLYYVFESKLYKPWMRWAWWAGSVVIVLLAGWQVGRDHIWADFGNGYYYGGLKILQNPDQLYYGENCGGYVNFPLLAYLFAPFGFMAKEDAGRIFFLINAVSILPLAYWLVKFGNLSGWKLWSILFLLLVSGPLDYSIWLGNSTNLIMLSMVIALFLFKHGKGFWTGVLLGINGLIKIPMIIPAGYFFITRQWKVVLGGAFVVGSVVALSFAFIPLSLNRMWLNNCVLSFSGHPVAAYNNQSVIGVLARELIPNVRINYWLPLEPTPLFNVASNLAVFLLFVPVVILLFRGWNALYAAPKYLLEFFAVLVCSLLTSPISWTHYFMFLLIPVAFYLDENVFIKKANGLNLLLLVSLILLAIPVNLTLALFEKSEQLMMLSPHFIGGILFYAFLLVLWVYKRDDFAK